MFFKWFDGYDDAFEFIEESYWDNELLTHNIECVKFVDFNLDMGTESTYNGNSSNYIMNLSRTKTALEPISENSVVTGMTEFSLCKDPRNFYVDISF